MIDIEAHQRLVGWIVSRMPVMGYVAHATGGVMDVDDMLSAGMEGLVVAAGRFDPERGLQFSTYAVPCIRGAVQNAVRRTHFRGFQDTSALEIVDPLSALGPPDTDHEISYESAVATLTETEAAVLDGHYRDGYSVAELAERYGVSRQRIYQIRDMALIRLRRRMLKVEAVL